MRIIYTQHDFGNGNQHPNISVTDVDSDTTYFAELR